MTFVEKATATLHDHGLRVTPQRLAILNCLQDNSSHPTAEEIAREAVASLPGMSLSTVYSTLSELESLGVISRLDDKGTMRFDPNMSPHAHLVCRGCGDIFDIPLNEEVADRVDAIVVGAGYASGPLHIEVSGTCPECLRNRTEAGEAVSA